MFLCNVSNVYNVSLQYGGYILQSGHVLRWGGSAISHDLFPFWTAIHTQSYRLLHSHHEMHKELQGVKLTSGSQKLKLN